MPRPYRARRAFTLLELIVVIVILGILATLAIPTFGRVIERTHDSVAQQTLVSIARDAQALHAFDPSDQWSETPVETAIGETGVAWAGSWAEGAFTPVKDTTSTESVPAEGEVVYALDPVNNLLGLSIRSATGRICALSADQVNILTYGCAPAGIPQSVDPAQNILENPEAWTSNISGGSNSGTEGGTESGGSTELPPALAQVSGVQVEVTSATSATVSWSVAPGDGSFAAAALLDGSASKTCSTDQSSCELTDLTPGLTYQVKVLVLATDGRISDPVLGPDFTLAPATPTDLQITNTETTYTATWTAVTGATGYTLEVTDANDQVSQYTTTEPTYTTDLNPGDVLTVRVAATNSGGSSPLSEPASVQRVPSTPDKPALTLSFSSGAWTASWPAAAGAESYNVETRVNSGSWVSKSTTDLSSTGTLAYGAQLEVRVTSVTGSMTSATSPVAAVTRPPATPSLSISQIDSLHASVSWGAASGATTYKLSYTCSSGTCTKTQTSRTLTFDTVPGTTWQVSVTAVAADGTLSTPGTASQSVPTWDNMSFQNGWSNYSSSFSSGRYTRSADGVVTVTGFLSTGTMAYNENITVLPVGYRPADRLIFSLTTHGTDIARIDVLPTGEVRWMYSAYANPLWVSLDGISFVASDSPLTRHNLSMTDGWTAYGSPWQTPSYLTDSEGRVHLEGLFISGTLGSGATIADIPNSDKAQYIPTYQTGSYHTALQITPTVLAPTSWTRAGYVPIQHTYYLASESSGWRNASLQNGWVTYSSTFAPLQYRKGADNIVTVRGFVKNGDTAYGTVVATLPVGYRPDKNIRFLGSSANQTAQYQVYTNGDIVIIGGASQTWTSFDSISFVAP